MALCCAQKPLAWESVQRQIDIFDDLAVGRGFALYLRLNVFRAEQQGHIAKFDHFGGNVRVLQHFLGCLVDLINNVLWRSLRGEEAYPSAYLEVFGAPRFTDGRHGTVIIQALRTCQGEEVQLARFLKGSRTARAAIGPADFSVGNRGIKLAVVLE